MKSPINAPLANSPNLASVLDGQDGVKKIDINDRQELQHEQARGLVVEVSRELPPDLLAFQDLRDKHQWL